MKRFLLFFALPLLSVLASHAQTITAEEDPAPGDVVVYINSTNFPDNNFRSRLLSLYPAGYLTSSDISNCTTLSMNSLGISDLTGIGYFTSLKTLELAYNSLSSLPTLPSSLKKLTVTYNHLTTLSSLPSGLTELYCSSNNMTSISSLPSSLSILNCGSNKLSQLPTIPSSLTVLEAPSNNFTSRWTSPPARGWRRCAACTAPR